MTKIDTKPEYAIPSMQEVRDLTPANGYNVVSLFAGCGGTGIGLEMAGFRVRWANEFVPAAALCHQMNFPESKVNPADIRKLTGERIWAESGIEGEIDLLEGSPPCNPFSLVGKRDQHWGEDRSYSDTHQRTDDLFAEYVRVLTELSPRIFIAENVPAIASGRSVGVLREALDGMQAAGYVVENRVLDAQWLGVPQRRERLFIVGIRQDVKAKHRWPVPLTYRYSINEAFATLEHNVIEPETDISHQAIGAEWRQLPLGKWSHRYMNLQRVSLEMPCPAITQRGGYGGVATVTHPYIPRKFSTAELKRLHGFPDDFILTGSFGQRWERVGRSVCPPVAAALGACIKQMLDSAT